MALLFYVLLCISLLIKSPRSGVTFMFLVRFRRVHVRRRKNFSLSRQNRFS